MSGERGIEQIDGDEEQNMKVEKDLHSVYIDGEMPKDFVAEYEDVLSKDAEVAAELKRVERVHEFFRADAESIKVSDEFVEESFARLQMKMRFAQTAKKAEKTPFAKTLRLPMSFAAAAAAFALIFTPAFVNSSSKVEKEVMAIAVAVADDIPALSEKTVAIDGNINSEKLADFAVSNSVATVSEPKSEQTNILSPALAEQKVVQAAALVTNSRTFRNNMMNVDAFRPRLNTMKMTLPAFGGIQEVPEISADIQNLEK